MHLIYTGNFECGELRIRKEKSGLSMSSDGHLLRHAAWAQACREKGEVFSCHGPMQDGVTWLLCPDVATALLTADLETSKDFSVSPGLGSDLATGGILPACMPYTLYTATRQQCGSTLDP